MLYFLQNTTALSRVGFRELAANGVTLPTTFTVEGL